MVRPVTDRHLVESGLAETVRQLRDERAIADTLYRYCHALDAGSVDEIMDCYTPEPVLDILSMHHTPGRTGTPHQNGVIHQGRAQVLDFYNSIRPPTAAPRIPTHHHINNLRVLELTDDSASTVCYMEAVSMKDSPSPRIVAYGRYLDSLLRSEDGTWRIQARAIELVELH
jgi:3-phenylpropionate/cinnamic acid dioxygenase small subunit